MNLTITPRSIIDVIINCNPYYCGTFINDCLCQMSSDDLVSVINALQPYEIWRDNWKLLKLITNRCQIEKITEDVIIAAINKHYASIEFLDTRSERVQLAAVKKSIRSLQFIKNPTEKVQMFAFKKSRKTAIKLLKNPCLKVQALINFM